MDFSQTRPSEPSAPPTEAALSYGPEPEQDDELTCILASYDQFISSPTQSTPLTSSFHPQYGPTGSSFAAEESSSFTSAAHAPPFSMDNSPWNNVVPGDIGPLVLSAVSGPSESFVYAAKHAFGGSAGVPTNPSPFPQERDHKTRDIFPCVAVSPPASGREVAASLHPEHEMAWYLVFRDAVVNGPRIFIPQTMYQPHSQGDKERYVSLANLNQPIIFVAQDSAEWGIPIRRLLSKQSVQLVDGNEPAFASPCGPTIGIRVQWPGYQPCHKQVATKDYTRKRRMICKIKLAKVVAKRVRQFMDRMSEQSMQVGFDRCWRVGPLGIGVDDVILVSLHHVSQGSWQPQLRLRRVISTGSVEDHGVIASPDTGVNSWAPSNWNLGQ